MQLSDVTELIVALPRDHLWPEAEKQVARRPRGWTGKMEQSSVAGPDPEVLSADGQSCRRFCCPGASRQVSYRALDNHVGLDVRLEGDLGQRSLGRSVGTSARSHSMSGVYGCKR